MYYNVRKKKTIIINRGAVKFKFNTDTCTVWKFA